MAQTSEKTWTARKVRQAYIDYFASQGHTFWPSSSTIPYEDPTLLFANAGMNQYKPIFLGIADPHSDLSKLKRAVNSQKCIRAGGKHNGLYSPALRMCLDAHLDRIHTCLQISMMLGKMALIRLSSRCWATGLSGITSRSVPPCCISPRYRSRLNPDLPRQKEAIQFSWNLLTKVYGIPPDRLYFSYFEGDKKQGLEPDLEAKQFWMDVGAAEDHIVPGNAKDNFWGEHLPTFSL